ncbi:hypothetical protein ABIB68_007916 [Bradyrhizobium sp. F1.2.2]
MQQNRMRTPSNDGTCFMLVPDPSAPPERKAISSRSNTPLGHPASGSRVVSARRLISAARTSTDILVRSSDAAIASHEAPAAPISRSLASSCFVQALRRRTRPLRLSHTLIGLPPVSAGREASRLMIPLDLPAAGRNEPNGRRTFHIGARVRLRRCNQLCHGQAVVGGMPRIQVQVRLDDHHLRHPGGLDLDGKRHERDMRGSKGHGFRLSQAPDLAEAPAEAEHRCNKRAEKDA